MKRRQPSSIDRLPPTIGKLIGRLRVEGRTYDEIVTKLVEMSCDRHEDLVGHTLPSRSAIARYGKRFAEVSAQLERSRTVAEALVAQFGSEPDNRVMRLNIELLHDLVFRLATATQVDEETGESLPMTFSPEDTMFLTRSLQSLASAQKTDFERVEKAETRAAKKATAEAAAKAVTAARAQGLSKDGVAAIRHAVLGSDA